MYSQPYLQPYKGISTRHKCPGCETKNTFTYYLDGNTNEIIHPKVGRCERESKCGYHYTPKQFFFDNPSLSPPLGGGWVGSACNVLKQLPIPKQVSPPQPMGVIPFKYVMESASYKSDFVRFLCEFMTIEQMTLIGENYALGATKTKEVIFWQIDTQGKVRTGKIMQYNPSTGKRIKHENGAIDWIHNKLKYDGTLPQNFNLKQCFFGEHLLKIYPDYDIAIVESEKTAIIASAIMPNISWLAAGNLNGLSVEKCSVLAGRNVILYPDLGAFEKWNEKASEIRRSCNCRITVSKLLEKIATPEAKEKGFDIADYLINQHCSKQQQPIQNHKRFSPDLQSMTEENPALLILIDRLELEEIIA